MSFAPLPPFRRTAAIRRALAVVVGSAFIWGSNDWVHAGEVVPAAAETDAHEKDASPSASEPAKQPIVRDTPNANGTAEAEKDAAPHVVRLALGANAAEKLSDLRLRRIVQIQLGGDMVVPVESTGPLDENAVRVFIDLPEPTRVTLQVQALGRELESRDVDVAGMSWEVATRYVALAVTESVRRQIAPKRKPRPRTPTPYEQASALASVPSFQVGGTMEIGYVEGLDTLLLGSRLFVGFHQEVLGEVLSLAAMGSIDGDAYFEADLMAVHRFWIVPPLRIDIGAGMALAAIKENKLTEQDIDLWVRVHGHLSIDLALQGGGWMTIAASPGFTVEPSSQQIGGAIAGSIGIAFERQMAPRQTTAP